MGSALEASLLASAGIYRGRVGCTEALEQSRNPFAVLVMAQLKTQQTRRDPEDRMRGKLELVKGLYQRGYTREEILELFRFIDWVMVLPEDLETRFEETLLSYEQEVHMLLYYQY
jgi:hypothetical protein